MVRPFTGRAQAVSLRTYQRPKGDGLYESYPEMIHRSHFLHQLRLWEENGRSAPNYQELRFLEKLGQQRKALLAGRTLWLGGTDYAFDRAACQFNCAFTEASTVYDIVDIAWLLLNGSGVGAKPRAGTLHGFVRPVGLQTIGSTRDKDWKGPTENHEYFLPTDDGGVDWYIQIGDSAVAWAKAIGKLLASPRRDIRNLILDFSLIRGPGNRLKGYGWICNGWEPLKTALVAIVEILNRFAGQLLPEIAIGDIINWIGTILSSRRSAEALLMDGWNPAAQEFMGLKREYWKHAPQRNQSNNSIIYWNRPSKKQLEELLHYADECGGDPGIVNGEAAVKKCPWFTGMNPCFEILLASKGFCNLVTLAVPAFERNFALLAEAVYFMARANYRQTCVDLRDGVLQPAWHQTNEALRLCGVSMTGLEQATWLSDYQIRHLRNQAIAGAYSMADEWGLPYPKAVTTIKPEGTSSKVLDCSGEGMHRPGGRFIFNWVNYPKDSPLVDTFRQAGYRMLPNGLNTLVCHPVEAEGIAFDKVNGMEVNLEPAVSQLRRYKRWNWEWADHNVSSTISYSPEEIPEIAQWVHDNWNQGYIATAFLRRIDPMTKPEDIGHLYLPQQVVTEEEFRFYADSLSEVNLDSYTGEQIDPDQISCKEGSCTIN